MPFVSISCGKGEEKGYLPPPGGVGDLYPKSLKIRVLGEKGGRINALLACKNRTFRRIFLRGALRNRAGGRQAFSDLHSSIVRLERGILGNQLSAPQRGFGAPAVPRLQYRGDGSRLGKRGKRRWRNMCVPGGLAICWPVQFGGSARSLKNCLRRICGRA